MFKIILSLKINEITKAGANHPNNEHENKCKKEETTNTVPTDLQLLLRTQKVYPKKLCIKKNTEDIDSRSAA